MGRILAPCAGEGIRPWDECLPHVLERVFVHGTNTCLANEHEADEYEYLFVFVFVQGV